MKRIKGLLSALSAEIMLIAGAFFVTIATARIDTTLMLYLIGVFFLLGGIFIAKNR